MSDPLRVALVCEGPTDKVVIDAALSNLLGTSPYIVKQLHPEESLAFGILGTGWGGVYRWCRQSVTRSTGPIRNDPLFNFYDLLVLHLDAEVAEESYANAGIEDSTNDLPCAHPCPPPENTTNPLRAVLLRWIEEVTIPPSTVFCTPSKNIETWVLCALYPHDSAVLSGQVECEPDPCACLQAKPADRRLVRGGRKDTSRYRDRAGEISGAWPRVRVLCGEAERFSTDTMNLFSVA